MPAFIQTAQLLGPELGLARAVGAISFAIIIGLLMHLIFRKEEAAREMPGGVVLPSDSQERSLWKDSVFFATAMGILVFANRGKPGEGDTELWASLYASKWFVNGVFGLPFLSTTIVRWFQKEELAGWTDESRTFAKQILPLLLGGVAVAGFLLGGPGSSLGCVLPSDWIPRAVGGNFLLADLGTGQKRPIDPYGSNEGKGCPRRAEDMYVRSMFRRFGGDTPFRSVNTFEWTTF